MIHAEITIKEIHYEKSFANLFPMGMEKCRQMEAPNLVIRFLLKMGDASMTAALGILNLMLLTCNNCVRNEDLLKIRIKMKPI